MAINAVFPGAEGVQPDAKTAQIVPTPRYSPGVADIVKLVDAKVDAEVIKTYIKNSPMAYNPNATEIIALKDRGVAPEILTAMLQRGAEVRAQGTQPSPVAANPVAPQAGAGAVAPYAPAYDYGAQPVYPNYAYSYPVNSYVYPTYDYAYPGYSYGYSWPYCWPALSFGFGCYPFGGYCGFGYPYRYGGRGFGAFYGGRGYWGGPWILWRARGLRSLRAICSLCGPQWRLPLFRRWRPVGLVPKPRWWLPERRRV
jgi:hypothetical protein